MYQLITFQTTALCSRNSKNRSPWLRALFLIPFALALAWFAVAPQARAFCRDGCLGNFNTVLGDDALTLATGGSNTAMGYRALYSNTTGGANTAIGDGALYSNTTGSANTANGYSALVTNTTGSSNTAIGYEALFNGTGNSNTAAGANALLYNAADNNTAVGFNALLRNSTGNLNTANGVSALQENTTGFDNTATGASALASNTTGFENTANGLQALFYNTNGNYNTADGVNALFNNTTGGNNTANGAYALYYNTTGVNNTAGGYFALYYNTGNDNTASGYFTLFGNTTGSNNTASGWLALSSNTTGGSNIAVGDSAGINLTTGSNNIDIGNKGKAGESNYMRIGTKGTHTHTLIAGISGATVAAGVGVIIDTNGHLGTIVSSERFKEAVQPMEKASEAILALKPVTFRYKHELDPEGIPQFGLVAEDVEKVNPDLVARDEHGKPYTVRYEAVGAMLLNEFLKEHRKVTRLEVAVAKLESAAAQQNDLQTTVATQQKQIDRLTAAFKEQANQIPKISAQLAITRPTSRVCR